MNVVEQQLLSALRETPVETDCSVSVRVLELLGHLTRGQQELWLSRHRPGRSGKCWYRVADRWEYCFGPPEPEVEAKRLPTAFRVEQPSPPALRSIVVKPLPPLQRARR